MADWPDGVGRRVLTQTDSTMAEAARLAPDLSGPEWILALSQSSAKGRRGRAWSMPRGNFAASLVMRPDGPVEQIALRSFVAALALRDALIATGAEPESLSLKWPNDVLHYGGKLAGILLESLGDGRGGVVHLIIGIGVNLAQAPETAELEPRAVPPVALGRAISPEAFLDVLAPAFAAREASLVTYGFGPTRTEWLAHAARLGEVITARLPSEEITGTFQDVDETGNLILETPKGRRAISAADIHF
ncbi:biotin--[acetyl-CoA-carboxylase] ligase [Gymnodinialimonas sp. 2305UL16-5]|uniref:biotin--[acetyl-CoA-carboxylase] ligase n=1 Tax=Gymnodinialimonas mytili TaxID=3126503 RepID=UPI0030A2AA1B